MSSKGERLPLGQALAVAVLAIEADLQRHPDDRDRTWGRAKETLERLREIVQDDSKWERMRG